MSEPETETETEPEPELQYDDTDPRRDVHIDEDQYEMFTELQNSEDSPFYKVENHDLFMFAVGYGRKKAMPQSTDEEHAFFGRSRLSDTQQTVIEAVAVQEERSVHVLRDQKEVYKIAEEYANGGVEKLYGRVFGPDDEDPLSELTLEVKETYESEVN